MSEDAQEAPAANLTCLKEMADVLLDASGAPGDRLAAMWRFRDVLFAWSEIEEDSAKQGPIHEETLTQDGLALSAADAARCLQDPERTAQFALGLRAAIESRQSEAGPMQVLYAGTGPFAALALLQFPYFTSEAVQFTFLDIHPQTTAATQRLITALGAEGYVAEWVTADACAWTPGPDGSFDVIVAEVMQAGLEKEPQVAVTRHLAQFLKPDGVFVPERIALSLCFVDTGAMTRWQTGERPSPPEDICLRDVFTLTAQGARTLAVTEDGATPWQVLENARDIPEGFELFVDTRIVTFGEFGLERGQSSLTTLRLPTVSGSLRKASQIRLRYRLGSYPGLEIVAQDG